MTGKAPPVPQENRSPKGTGSDPKAKSSDLPARPEHENADEQGQSANTKQNTVGQGSHGKRGR